MASSKDQCARGLGHLDGGWQLIAILDTGVDRTHPDLAAQMVPGWNFYDGNSNTSDVHGHGAAVAGAAAAASNNGVGVASVAGGARIMPVRIADPTAYAYWSTVAQGITWAADHGASVANISYVGASASSTIRNAASYFRSKGGTVFVCAGNTGAMDNTSRTDLVTVVSATDSNDQLASFSTYGNFVDLAAPGASILTTSRGGGYQYWSGTSIATPIAAATAALIFSERPDFAAAQTASDNSGIAGITQSIYVDGVLKATGNGAALAYNWNTRKIAKGAHDQGDGKGRRRQSGLDAGAGLAVGRGMQCKWGDLGRPISSCARFTPGLAAP